MSTEYCQALRKHFIYLSQFRSHNLVLHYHEFRFKEEEPKYR